MAVNLKTQVAIDVELNTDFKDAKDLQLVESAAVALSTRIKELGRAFLQTNAGYQQHIRSLKALHDNQIIGTEGYKETAQALANATRQHKLQTEAVKAEAEAIAMLRVNQNSTTKDYEKQIKLLDQIITTRTKYINGLEDMIQDEMDPDDFLNVVDAMAQEEEALQRLAELRTEATNLLRANTAAININIKAHEILGNSYKITVNGIAAQKKALLEVFNELEQNDDAFLLVAEAIRRTDEESEQFTKHLQKEANQSLEANTQSLDANSKAHQVLSNTYKETINGIAAQKKALLEVFNELGKNDDALLLVAEAIRRTDEESEQFTKHLEKIYTSTEAYNKALELMKTTTFSTTNEINKQKNALVDLLGYIQIASKEYNDVETEIQTLGKQQRAVNNEFLQGSIVVSTFLQKFEGQSNTARLNELNKQLQKNINNTEKLQNIQNKIQELQKPIKIAEITDENKLKQIIEAVKLLSEGISETGNNFKQLQNVGELAQQTLDKIGATTQNTNRVVDATLIDIKTGFDNIQTMKPIDFAKKFVNIEQVNNVISRLKATQNIINFTQNQGQLAATKPGTLKEIQVLLEKLEELKKLMTEVTSVAQKPLRLREELQQLQQQIPSTVGQINELQNAYSELLNKILVKQENKLFVLDNSNITELEFIQQKMLRSSYVAQKLKQDIIDIFVGLKGKAKISGLDKLIIFSNAARSVNELQEAITKLENVRTDLSLVYADEQTLEKSRLITEQIEKLRKKLENVQNTFKETPTLTLTEELQKLQKEMPTTVGAINQLENAYAELLKKVSVTQQTGTSLFNINSNDIARVTQIQKDMLQASIAAQKLKQDFASIFVGEKLSKLQKQQENLSNEINKRRNDEIQLLQQQQQEQAKLNQLTEELKSNQKLKKYPFTPVSENLIKKLIIEILQTKHSIENLGNSIANTNNELIVLEHNLNNTIEQLEDMQKVTGLDDLLDFANSAKSVNELQLAISKLETMRSDLPLINADNFIKEQSDKITATILDLQQRYENLTNTFKKQEPPVAILTLAEEFEKLQKEIPTTVDGINQLENAYAQLINKVSVDDYDFVNPNNIELLQKIQAEMIQAAYRAQNLKQDITNIFLGLKGNTEQRSGLDELIDFSKSAKSVNELQAAISKLQNVRNDLDLFSNSDEVKQRITLITNVIKVLQKKYEDVQNSFKEPLQFKDSIVGINEWIKGLRDFIDNMTKAEKLSSSFSLRLNEINQLKVQQQFNQIQEQGSQYQLGAIDEALKVQPEEFQKFNQVQLESYLQMLEGLQKLTTNNIDEFNKLANRIKEVNVELENQRNVGQETLTFWQQLKQRIMGVSNELDEVQMGSEEFLQTLEMMYFQFDNFFTRFMQQSVSNFATIQAEILRVTATAGDATEKEMTKIVETATMAASASSNEVANIMLIGARAGLDKTEIEQFTQPVIAGMEATGASAEIMASTVVDSLRAFKLPFTQTTQTIDLFTQVANKSNQEVSDIADALKYVGPYAASLNVDITDLGGVLAILANAGIRGTEAGTGLRMALSRLAIASNATSGASLGLTENQERLFKVMKQLGIEIKTKEGNLIPLVDILIKLKQATANYDSTQKAELVTALFGIESAGKMIAALNLTEVELRATANEIANNTGLTKQLQEQINGTDYAFKQFSNSMSLMTNQFGKALAEMLLPFTRGLTDLMNGFNSMSPEARNAAASIAVLTASFVVLISTIAIFTSIKGQLQAALLLFGTAIGSVTTAVTGLTSAFTGFFATANLGTLAGIGILLGKFAIAAAAVTAAVVLLSAAFGDANDEKNKFADNSKFNALESSLESINDLIAGIKSNMKWINENTPEWLKDLLNPFNTPEGIRKLEEKRLAPYYAEIERKKQEEEAIKVRQLITPDIEFYKQLRNAGLPNQEQTNRQVDANLKLLKDFQQSIKEGLKLPEIETETFQRTVEHVQDLHDLLKRIQPLVTDLSKQQLNVDRSFGSAKSLEERRRLVLEMREFFKLYTDRNVEELSSELLKVIQAPDIKLAQDAFTAKFRKHSADVWQGWYNSFAAAYEKAGTFYNKITKSTSNVQPQTEGLDKLQEDLRKMAEEQKKAEQKRLEDTEKANTDYLENRTKIERDAIEELRKANIDAADSIDKYKKDNIEKLAQFRLQKERQIQEAELQLSKNVRNTVRNKQDFDVSMEMISRRLRGESTFDLEYKYRLKRILEDREQSLEDVRYNKIKNVQDLEQEIINIRKEGEKAIFEIWSDLYTKRQSIVKDAQQKNEANETQYSKKLTEINKQAAEALGAAFGDKSIKDFVPKILDLQKEGFYKKEDITKLLEKVGLSQSTFETYRNALHYRETRGEDKPYQKVNEFGFAGAYQIGSAVRTDALKLAKELKIDITGLDKTNIADIAPIDQEKLLLLVIGVYRNQLKEGITNFEKLPISQQIQLLFTAHGHGAGEAIKLFNNRGLNIPDGNNVLPSKTYTEGENLGKEIQKTQPKIQKQSGKRSLLPVPAFQLATNTKFGIGGTSTPSLNWDKPLRAYIPGEINKQSLPAVPPLPALPPPPVPQSSIDQFNKLVPIQFDDSIKTNIPAIPAELTKLQEEQIKPFIELVEKVIDVTKKLEQSQLDLTSSLSLDKLSSFVEEIVSPVLQISDNYNEQEKVLREQKRLFAEGINPELIEQTAQLNIQQSTNRRNLEFIQEEVQNRKNQTQELINQNNLQIQNLSNQPKLTEEQQQQLTILQAENSGLTEQLNTLTDIASKTKEAYDYNEKMPEAIRKQKEELDEFNLKLQNIKDLSQGIATALGNGVKESLLLVINGTENWGEALDKIIVNVLNTIIEQLLYITVIQPFVKETSNWLSGIFGNIFGAGVAGAAGGAGAAGAAVKAVAGAIRFADGGVMTNRGMKSLQYYAKGGIADSPQLAMFGEGSMPEAYVPLPDGRRIPVVLSGATGSNTIVGGSTSVVVNVDASNTKAAGDESRANQLGEQLAKVIQAEIIKQKLPGGLLY